MALVQTGFVLSVSVIDMTGQASALTYELTAADYATATADAATIIAALADVTGGVIGKYEVKEIFEEDALVLPAGFQNENKASITVNLDAPGVKRANIQIPAALIDIFSGATGKASDIVDANDADLLTYVSIWQTTGGVATLSDGETLSDTDPIDGGKRVFRAVRKT